MIETQFKSAMSPKITGGAGSQSGPELSGVEGMPTLRSINGSPIVSFDSTSAPRIPRSEELPSTFETSIPKSGR